MVDKSIFEPYLIRDEETGEIIGLNENAPTNAQMAFRIWKESELDKQRLADLFSAKPE